MTQFTCIALIAILGVAAGQLYAGYGHGHGHEHVDYHAPPKYKFDYGVVDGHTGDNKNAWEHRDGHLTKGAFDVQEPDGTHRVVEYVVDEHGGFQPVVKREGHAVHPYVYGHADGHGHGHGDHGHGHATSYANFNLHHHAPAHH